MLRTIISQIASRPARTVPEAFVRAEEALHQAGIVFTVTHEWTERTQHSNRPSMDPPQTLAA